MSRTDKTDPFPVKIARSKRVEVHDHTNGVCELKADPNRQREYIPSGSPKHQCYLDADYYEPQYRCSCWSCKGGSWLVKEKSKAKTSAKRYLRSWEKDYR
jgi:hypothetical protein